VQQMQGFKYTPKFQEELEKFRRGARTWDQVGKEMRGIYFAIFSN
jgi:hypothetical protein